MFSPFSVTSCSLELLRAGERGIVTLCKSQNEIIFKKLISKGVTPGSILTLEQTFPSLIIKIVNTYIELNIESSRVIYVRIIDN